MPRRRYSRTNPRQCLSVKSVTMQVGYHKPMQAPPCFPTCLPGDGEAPLRCAPRQCFQLQGGGQSNAKFSADHLHPNLRRLIPQRLSQPVAASPALDHIHGNTTLLCTLIGVLVCSKRLLPTLPCVWIESLPMVLCAGDCDRKCFARIDYLIGVVVYRTQEPFTHFFHEFYFSKLS